MWEPQAPTYFHTHSHSHTHTVHYQRILIKNKVYHNITNWMILIGFLTLIGLIERGIYLPPN